MRPKLLDLFCGGGGCSVGFHRSGFDVTGVDIEPHDDYPFSMIVGDAMSVLSCPDILAAFDVVAGSPPCPRYSAITPDEKREGHPDLVGPVRDALRAWGGIYVIENVPGAPLDHPALYCGKAMGLPHLKRHRIFESNVFLMSPGCACDGGPTYGVYGDHGDKSPRDRAEQVRRWGKPAGVKARDVAHAQEVMGIDWMTKWDDLADAIPPAYTEHIGRQLLAHMTEAVAS